MKRLLVFCLSVLFLANLFAQTPIQFGRLRVILPANVSALRTSKRAAQSDLTLGLPVGDYINVLVQCKHIPSIAEREELAARGLVLYSSLGSNAYWAGLKPESRIEDFVGSNLQAVAKISHEWIIDAGLLTGNVPPWTRGADGKYDCTLYWHENAAEGWVRSRLEELGATIAELSSSTRQARVYFTPEQIKGLKEDAWLAMVVPTQAPLELYNDICAAQAGGRVLGESVELGGRNLTGAGVRVGIWDETMDAHIDWSTRTTILQTDIQNKVNHGMHVCGTVAGSGLLNPLARGVAPKATIFANNYLNDPKKPSVSDAMLQVRRDHGITITQNSYGVAISNYCGYFDWLSYSFFGLSMNIDLLSYAVPDLTHIYAAGNYRNACGYEFGTVGGRSKNCIYVGAVDTEAELASFSSVGPMDDGRLVPTICTRGVGVLSTVKYNRYEKKDGTSMACPTASGHAALLTERYKQLNGGTTPLNYLLKGVMANTADDLGNLGPDYKYGFGLLNAEAAVQVLENRSYKLGTLVVGKEPARHKITLPAGVAQLRAMLVWNDPVAVKQYEYGESILVNDLDLHIEAAGKKTLPWVLDHKNPGLLAKRGEDHINNIEQVTIENPAAGEYELVVSGNDKIRDKGIQDYAVVWYYDMRRPELVAPRGGESFSPGEQMYVRTRNLAESAVVELSYDGGKNFVELQRGSVRSLAIPIPSDAPATQQALLRVVDSKGEIVLSRPFTIMGVPTELEWNEVYCGWTGWELQWKAVDGAAKYQILRARLETEDYEVVGESTLPQFALPESAVDQRGGNIYSVRAVSPNGVIGRRAEAIVTVTRPPLTLSKEQLPFRELFRAWPYWSGVMLNGKDCRAITFTREVDSSVLTNANGIQVTARVQPEHKEHFMYEEQLFRLRLCKLDLRSIPANTKIAMATQTFLRLFNNAEDERFRIVVLEGGNATELERMGRKPSEVNPLVAEGRIVQTKWDLTPYAGKEITLELQASLIDKNSVFMLYEYSIEEYKEVQDVGLAEFKLNNFAEKLGTNEKLTIVVRNKTAVQYPSIPVRIFVRGKEQKVHEMLNVLPYEERTITMDLDLSTPKRYGEIFPLSLKIDLPEDNYKQDNEYGLEVYNMGDVYPLHVGEILFNGVGYIPQDPRQQEIVSDSISFVDPYGALARYPKELIYSTVRFLPSDPDNKIALDLFSYNLAEGDSLRIWTRAVVDNLDFNPTQFPPDYVFVGSSYSHTDIESQAPDGALVVQFVSGFNKRADGWLGRVYEKEAATNTLALTLVPFEERYPSQRVPIKVKVENKDAKALKHATVQAVMPWWNFYVRGILPVLEPQKTIEYTLPNPVPAPYPTRTMLDVRLAALDGDLSDNVVQVELKNDKFWYGGLFQALGKLPVTSVQNLETTLDEYESREYLQYDLSKTLPFSLTNKNYVRVGFGRRVTAADLPASVHFWVDTDVRDSALQDNNKEYFKAALVADQDYVDVPIDLSQLGLKAQKTRMRLVLVPDADFEKFKKGEKAAWGFAIDHMAQLQNTPTLPNNDLAAIALTTTPSGLALGANNTVRVVVVNRGLASAEKFKVRLLQNGAQVAEETVDAKALLNNAEGLTPLRGELTYEFGTKLDFSQVGEYKLRVELEADNDESNNVAETAVYHLAPPKTDALYSLRLGGNAKLRFPNLNGLDLFQTYEGWFYTEKDKSADLFRTDGFRVILEDETMGTAGAITVQLGEDVYYQTNKAVVPLDCWTHIAVAFDYVTHGTRQYTDVSLYVNGTQVALTSRVSDILGEVNNLEVGNDFVGRVKGLRVWKALRSQAEIAATMYTSALPAPDCLAECLTNEGQGKVLDLGLGGVVVYDGAQEPEWVKEERLLQTFSFLGQVTAPTVLSEKYVAEMERGYTNWTGVNGTITPRWGNATILYAGNPVNEHTVYDFSATPHEVNLNLSTTIYGVTVTENATLLLKEEENTECKLLSYAVLAQDNMNQKVDLNVSSVTATQRLMLEHKSATEFLDASKITITFTSLSAGAKVFYGDNGVTEGGKLTLDLRSPKALYVRAANGRSTSVYTFALFLPQELHWSSEPIELVYSREATKLEAATSTAGLPVLYRSANENIVTVDAAGNLLPVGVGETDLYALQQGEAGYAAAEPKKRKVRITPAKLLIDPIYFLAEPNAQLPRFRYWTKGLLGDERVADFKPVKFALYLPDGSEWTSDNAPAKEGSYAVCPKDYTAPYQDGNYIVTVKEGVCHVTRAAVNVNYQVKGETSRGDLYAEADGALVLSGDKVKKGSHLVFYATPSNPAFGISEWHGITPEPENRGVAKLVAERYVNVDVSFDLWAQLAVSVQAEGRALPEATIRLEGIPAQRSDTEGLAKFIVARGKIKYEILKEGYETKTGVYTLKNDAKLEVELTKSTSIEDSIWNEILVTPNPFVASLYITMREGTETVRYELLNTQGILVRSGAMEQGRVEIPTQELPSGVYLLRLRSGSGSEKVYRVVKTL